MFANNGYPSVADIAAAFPNRGNNDGNGFGGDGGWWILIILLAMWGGFGGNGWGNGGNNRNSEFTDAALQRGFDNQTVINKLDGINSGLCSLGYDQLAQMNGINTNIMQTGYAIERAIQADTVANMQNANALSTQFANCCCEQKGAIKDLQYTIAQNDCAIKSQIHETGDAIIQNANWNARDMRDLISNGFAEIERQNLIRENQALRDANNNSQRQAEFQQWANYITSYLAPKVNPAFISCNPNTGMILPEAAVQQIAWQVAQQLNGNCGCNSGCGCGNNFGGCCG